jgi:predicted phage terminase large subunit-like protein
MNVLSLFDGMSCGQIALKKAGITVDNYYASEIDKYAIQIAKKNFPDMIHIGDVTKVIGSELPKIDLLIGGSPCQGFSFAGKQLNFDDPRSALFFEFVRLLKECKPKYFLLENVRMKQEFQDVISEHLGVQPIKINSSLVSAQNRVRLYWTNIPNVVQPDDKEIVLKDILETGIVDRDKSFCIDANYFKGGNLKSYFEKHRRQLVFSKDGLCHVGDADLKGNDSIKRVYHPDGKSPTLTTMGGGHREPKILCGAWRGRYIVDGKRQDHKGRVAGKTKLALTPNVSSQPILKDCARTTITKIGGRLGTEQHPMMLRQGGQSDLKVDMALTKTAIIKYFKHKTGYVIFVINRLLNKTLAATGVTNYVLTTTTIQEKLEPFYAMTATSPSDMQKIPLQQKPLQNTSDFITDKIESITYAGKEEVFDVQIDRTENFIANGIVSHNTRWSKLDLTGEIVNQMLKNDEVDEWEVVEFPAIIEDKNGVEKPLWPEFWPIEELHAKRAALDVRYWNAQYLQNPTSEEGALIKREWWSRWTRDNPPSCEFIIMSLDAAQEKNTRADYNALTTWGVFFNEETDNYNIILLNAIKERLEFPELKDLCLREYKDWEPDAFIIEKKSNGAALYQEFRRMGIPLGEFTPGKGQDKIARVNSVSDLFRSGIVWAPEKRWAEEVIEECNDFPSGTNDDLVDSTTMALMRFRQGGFIRLPSDEEEEIRGFRSSKGKALYAI